MDRGGNEIQLYVSASAAVRDGLFTSGPLKGTSVSVKWYTSNGRLLNEKVPTPDHDLVQSERAGAVPAQRPRCIDRVYLFDGRPLLGPQQRRGRKIGAASSVPRKTWRDAGIYPNDAPDAVLRLSSRPRYALTLLANCCTGDAANAR